MELDRLRAFLHVAEAGSIQEAARRMGRSQPALSRLVMALEADLGRPLLDRSTRPASLTEGARALVDRVRGILEAVDGLAGGKAGSAPLRMGLSSALARRLATPAAARILASPPVPVALEAGWSLPLLHRLREGRLEAALLLLAPGWAPPPDLAARRLALEPLAVVAPRTLEVPSPVPLAHLAGHPWILNPEGCGIRARLQEAFGQAGRTLRTGLEVAGPLSDHVAYAAAGFGLAAVPRALLKGHARRGGVRVLRVDPPMAASLWALARDLTPRQADLWARLLGALEDGEAAGAW